MAFAVSNKVSLRSAASKRSVAAKAKTTKGTTSGGGGAGAISNIDYLKSLPGVSQPFPDVFDPANLSATASVKDLRRWRESELVHGRISMLAALGFVVQENIEDNTAFFPFAGKITGPAIYHFQQIKQGFWEPLLILIGIAEAYRVAYGWAPPVNGENFNALREDYDMGDLGFDPLGLKPKDLEALKDLQTKELNNGRLAMIAVAGFVGQELLFQHEVLNWGGFQQSLAEAPVDPSDIKPPPLPVEFPDRGVPNIKDIRVPNAKDVKDAVNYSSGKGFLNFSTPSGGEVANKTQELKSNLPSVPNPLDGLKSLASNLPSGGEIANKAQEAKNSLPGSLPSGGEIANKAQEIKNNLPGLPSFGGFKSGVEDAVNNLSSSQDVANKADDIKDSLPSFSGFRTSLAQNLPSGGEIANKAQEAKNSLPGSLPSGGEIANKAQEIKNNLPGLPSFGGFKSGVEDAVNNLSSGQDVANKADDIKDSLPSFSGLRTSLAQNLPSGGEIANKAQEAKNSLPGSLPSGGEIANKAQEIKNNLPGLPSFGGFKAGVEDAVNNLPSGQDVANKAGDIKDSLPSFSGFKTSLAQNLPSGGEIANKAQEVKNNLPDLPSLPNLSGFKTGLAENAQEVKNSLPSTQDVKNALPNPQDIFNKVPDVPTPQVSVSDVRTPGTSF